MPFGQFFKQIGQKIKKTKILLSQKKSWDVRSIRVPSPSKGAIHLSQVQHKLTTEQAFSLKIETEEGICRNGSNNYHDLLS